MRLIASLLFCACLAILPDGMAAAKIVDEIVAQVNDEVITLSELEQAMKYIQANPAAGAKVKNNQAFRRQALEMLIDRKLAKEEAKRYGITVPKKKSKRPSMISNRSTVLPTMRHSPRPWPKTE